MKRPTGVYLKWPMCLVASALVFSLVFASAYAQPAAERNQSRRLLVKKSLERIREVVGIQKRHSKRLMDILGVRAAATGIASNGQPEIKIFVSRTGIRGIPASLDGVPVKVEVTEPFYAYEDPAPTDKWPRPVPIGISTGHPDITAGTIGARVTDGTIVYALSNNHVYANVNNAFIGDGVIQPGSIDGGQLSANIIGTLADYEPINFCQTYFIWLICAENTVDAAIADVSGTAGEPLVRLTTPANGYGAPNSIIHEAYGQPEVIDDPDEDIAKLLGLSVQKYGRTTGLTAGTIDAVNATVDVCYNQSCSLRARFTDQIIIVPGDFSGGGDSGSMIVTYARCQTSGVNGGHGIIRTCPIYLVREILCALVIVGSHSCKLQVVTGLKGCRIRRYTYRIERGKSFAVHHHIKGVEHPVDAVGDGQAGAAGKQQADRIPVFIVGHDQRSGISAVTEISGDNDDLVCEPSPQGTGLVIADIYRCIDGINGSGSQSCCPAVFLDT